MTKLERLERLRGLIPEMKCIPGCTSCCGHTAWSEFEWSLIPEEARERFDFFSFKCSFVTEEGCSIHADRSIICRMFGVTVGMPCPKGVPVERMIDEQTASAISKSYLKHFFSGESQQRKAEETDAETTDSIRCARAV